MSMIINTGGRTDIVQYYSKWLLNRFKEGYVLTMNPMFSRKIYRYELNPDMVDCVIFCSKNYKPILNDLHEITDKFNTYFYYTITAYGNDIEPGVLSIDESIETLIELSETVGSKRLAWRYDPILLTYKYTINSHFKMFDEMASKISSYIDHCIFSFVELYKKVEKNMPEIIPLTQNNMNYLAENLGLIADKYDLYLQTCGTENDYSKYNIHSSGCMTLNMLGRANNVEFKKLKHKGTRLGCNCIESRDIGSYNSCINKCKYCYANKNPDKTDDNYKLHDPTSPLLIGNLKDNDIIQQGRQKTMLKKLK